MEIRDVKIHQPVGLLRILTDSECEGWCLGVSEPTARQIQACCREALIGQDPINRERIWQGLQRLARVHGLAPPVWGCVDVALWDLAAKAMDMPIFRFIGGFRDGFPAYRRGVGCPKTDDLVEDALQAVDEGFLGYKIRCEQGAEETIQAAERVRDAVGPDFYLMLDGAERFNDYEAMRVGHALEELDFHWFEEPIRDPSLQRLKRLADGLDIPIVSGGAVASPGAISDLLAQQAVDRVRVGLPGCGGITDLIKIARLTEAFGVNCEVSSSGPGYCFAHAQLLGAIKNCDFYEGQKAGSQGGEPFVRNPLKVEQGYVQLPTGAGLGVELNWEEVERRTEKIG